VFVVEADGGSRGNPGPAGYGAVVMDATDRQVLAETAEYIGRATNNVAEYRGLVAGLRAALTIDPGARIEVRMDSKLVVEQMSGRWKIKHPDMIPLAAEARAVFPPGRVTYQWMPRAKNKHADRLANEAMDAGRAGKQWQPSGAVPERVAEPEPDPEPAATSATPAPASNRSWAVRPDLGPGTTLVMLRHGETALTPEQRFSGSGGSDPELSTTGRRQAAAVAEALAARGTVQAVVCSPLLRCRQTAEAVAGRLGLEVRIDEGIRETSFGDWDGLTFAEVRERWPEELDAWLDSTRVAPPGGESFAETEQRVTLSRDKLLARYPGKTVLLVTHVTPIKTLLRLALGAPPESMHRMRLSPASLSVIQQFADGGAVLRLFNETSALRG
jgi:probable phosphoglycerate mutase